VGKNRKKGLIRGKKGVCSRNEDLVHLETQKNTKLKRNQKKEVVRQVGGGKTRRPPRKKNGRTRGGDGPRSRKITGELHSAPGPLGKKKGGGPGATKKRKGSLLIQRQGKEKEK